MNDTATQQGAAPSGPHVDPDVKSDELEIRSNPRQAALDAMAERQEQERRQELDEALAADPDLAAAQARIDGQIAESNAEAGIYHDDTPSYGGNIDQNDGAASRKAMHQAQPEPARPDLPSNLQDDPMADFIEMVNGQPMVKAKVNGEDRFIPLPEAKRQVQIGVAAEIRMQSAAQKEKEIAAREQKLTASEAALQARSNVLASQPTTPAKLPKGLSDKELEAQATEIFETAFSGTEEDAAKKLAKTLVRIRDSAAARVQPTQPIDTRAIAEQAASIATGTLTAQERKKDVTKGYKAFKDNYPDIVSDPYLFRMADDLTDQIEKEHPDWNISQVMDEAGQRTRAWVKDLSGQGEDTGANPNPQPPGNQNSPVSDVTTQTRQERKAGLVRMPSSAAAAQYAEPEQSAEGEQSPQDAFAELKRSRGQPY
jgi:hypothetical protein